jgi:hypothetical protein
MLFTAEAMLDVVGRAVVGLPHRGRQGEQLGNQLITRW